VTETAQVELKADECKPLPVSLFIVAAEPYPSAAHASGAPSRAFWRSTAILATKAFAISPGSMSPVNAA